MNANVDVFEVGDLRLDPDRNAVWRGNSEVILPGLSFELLNVLAKKWPETVSHRELVSSVWGDVLVSDDAVRQRVSLLRKSLGSPDYVVSVKGIGYRLAKVTKRQSRAARKWIARPVFLWSAAGIAVVAFVLSLPFTAVHTVVHAIMH